MILVQYNLKLYFLFLFYLNKTIIIENIYNLML